MNETRLQKNILEDLEETETDNQTSSSLLENISN